MEYRLHVIGLPHTKVNGDYNSCAYTAKLHKFMKMFPDAILYANKGSAPVKKFVPIYDDHDLTWHFGNEEWYEQEQWYKVSYDYNLPHWKDFNNKVVSEMKSRIGPYDIILTLAGVAQKSIADAFPNNICCEMGIGYEGIFSKYKVFESYAWMHYLYGKTNVNDGNFYDAVIPNFFDTSEFELGTEREDYLLFMGRPIDRKGIAIVRELAKHYHVIAAGAEQLEGEGIEWVGYADAAKRRDLMKKARAVLVPTLYIAPFEGVNVEAQLCGTPVITTDFGAFSETVVDGVTGFRCHVLSEFMEAVEMCRFIDHAPIRSRARDLYSLEAVKSQYERYFKQLMGLYGNGWYDR